MKGARLEQIISFLCFDVTQMNGRCYVFYANDVRFFGVLCDVLLLAIMTKCSVDKNFTVLVYYMFVPCGLVI